MRDKDLRFQSVSHGRQMRVAARQGVVSTHHRVAPDRLAAVARLSQEETGQWVGVRATILEKPAQSMQLLRLDEPTTLNAWGRP